MIVNDEELQATLNRIPRFQSQLLHLSRAETNPENYRLASTGFFAEIDRMQLEVREYLMMHPAHLEIPALTRPPVREVFAYWPELIAKNAVRAGVSLK